MIQLNYFYLQRVHLDIQVGDYTINSDIVAQKDTLSEFQLRRIHQLLGQVEQIIKEQNYQRVLDKLHSSYKVKSYIK